MSDYFRKLSKTGKRRYEEKLNDIGLENVEKSDPFLTSDDWVDDVKKWPEVEFGQIYVYLIDSPGPYTRESMKAYRSLDAYQQFFYGWVRTCYIRETNNSLLLKAKVTRSQAVTETPHEAWCAFDKTDSTVLTGHCSCMAGQGEVCIHVAAVLFKVEACTRLGFNKVSCTSVPCAWNQNFTKKVEAAIIQDISFRKPKRENFHFQPEDVRVDPQPLQFADTTAFLEKLKRSNKSAVIFSVTNPKPQPKFSGPALPSVLSNLYSVDNVVLSPEELRVRCQEVFGTINFTVSQAEKLEAMTRQQSNCSLWYQFRKGRITASNFHEVLHSDTEESSSPSLLKKIMHYNASFSTCATEWGLKHEQVAIDKYKETVKNKHTNFQVKKCGLVVNDKFPYLAASPDAWVSCACCGSGVVEVKCPFIHRDHNPCEINDIDQKFFLVKHSSSNSVCPGNLKKNHKHYSQIMGQIHLAEVGYCDFLVWTTKGLHIERIKADKNHFENMEPKLKGYFINIVLPELLTNKLKSEIESSKLVTSYCFCGKKEDYDNMIACDSKTCPKEWYHVSCVGLKDVPKGKWLCLTCSNTKRGKRKVMKKK